MRVLQNERGLTLTELMAAVVILGIVAVPLTSIGTTFLHSSKAQQQSNEAVLFAEKTMVNVKLAWEADGLIPEELAGGIEGEFTWQVQTAPYQLNEELIEDMIKIEVIVTYTDRLDKDMEGQYTLTAVTRQKETRP